MLQKITLSVVVALLLIFNCFVILKMDQEYSRGARLASTSVIFFLLLWQNSYSKKMVSAFLLLLLSDILLFYYEYPLVNMLTFLSRTVAYSLLILAVVPELRNLRTNLFQKLVFIFVLVLNGSMLVVLMDMVPDKFLYTGLDYLFYAYGSVMIGMVIAAVSYSNRYANKISFYYTGALLCLVFADVSSFIGYYLEFDAFYVPDRIFYLLGIAGLVRFASFSRSHKAVPQLESL